MSPFIQRALAQAPLTCESELLLATAARAGDLAAREELICSGLRLVALHGLRLGHRGEDLEEAFAAGVEGLIMAVDRFDPLRGARLATYAWQWIARAMTPASPGEPAPEQARPNWDCTILADLPEQWAAVLGLRFGLLCPDGVGLTISEVSKELSLSAWQVRDRESKALSHLRKRLAKVGRRAPVMGADPL